MKIKINTNILTKKLTRAIFTLNSGNQISIPALKSVHFNVQADKVEITGSNGKTSIKTEIIQDKEKLMIERTGTFMLSSRNLLELVKKIDAEFVVIEQTENNTFSIATSKSRVSLTGFDINTYPKHNFDLVGTEVTWTTKMLKEISREVVFAADKENKQQNASLKGVNCVSDGTNIKIVATNAHRLSSKQVETSLPDFNVIMQPLFFRLLPKFIDQTAAEIKLHISNEKTQVVLGNDILQFQNIQGTFPDVSKIIPKEFMSSVIVNRVELSKALERIDLFSLENKKVKLVLNEKNFLLGSQQNANNSVMEKIESYNMSGSEIEISFSLNYLIDAITAAATDEIKIEFTSAEKPFVVWNNKDQKTIYLISPFRNN